jgi:hypothetical protein
MCPMILCLAAAALGFDVGWRPRPQGGMEYVVQLSVPTVEALRAGEMIESDIPPEVKDVRAIRLVVGSARLPRELPLAAAMPPTDRLPPPTAPTIDPKLADVSPIGPVEAPAKANSMAAPQAPLAVPQSPLAAPQTLPPGVAGEPIAERTTALVQPLAGAASPQPGRTANASTAEPSNPAEPEPQPWLLLTVVALGLFASFGGNLYLGWVCWDVHRRYRGLLAAQGTTARS